MLHPQGLAPRIVNLAEWRVHILNLLQHQMDSDGDAVSEALLMEVVGYPNSPTSDVSATSTGPQRFATPIRIASPNGTMIAIVKSLDAHRSQRAPLKDA
jgi:hypothetical protein